MLNYTIYESSTSSRFIITTPAENISILAFNYLENEEMYFNNDFLQENVVEMVVAKVTKNTENYCKEFALTVKHIFDYKLEKDEGAIIYICIPQNSLKHQLMIRYIKSDDNDHFKCLTFKAEEKVFCFFLNEQKTSSIDVWNALIKFFKEEYGINFGTVD